MDTQAISKIIHKYNEGNLSEAEETQLLQWIEEGLVNLNELHDVRSFSEKLDPYMEVDVPKHLDQRFWGWLYNNSKSAKPGWLASFLSRTFTIQTALASVVVFILGLSVGLLISNPRQSQHMASLQDEVSSMKQLMMITLMDKASTTDRLKAVTLANQLTEVNQQIIDLLLKTLREDGNTNVRLAALDALHPYVDRPMVREGLITSIEYQDSPLVLLALADLMVSIRERQSVEEFRKQLHKDLPEEVIIKLENSIEKLI
jgi:hypothetical protein